MNKAIGIGDKITAKIGNGLLTETVTAKVIGFGQHKGKPVIDLDNGRFCYPSQVMDISPLVIDSMIKARAELLRIQGTDNGPLSHAIIMINTALVELGVNLKEI